MNIFKEVPSGFHHRFTETINEISDEYPEKEMRKVKRSNIKRILPLTAAAVLAMSAITAGAVYFYEWNQAAKDRLGVDDPLAAQMVQDQTAKEETASAVSEGVEIKAIQAVSLDRSFYVLLSVTVPDGVTIDGDTIFEFAEVESKTPFQGCIVNSVEGSFEGNESLWEVFLYKESGTDYEGAEAVITLKNLVQTKKLTVTKTVAEGEWKLPVTLPREQDLLVKEEEFDIEVGHHLLSISRQEISPFEIRLYGDMDEIRHALDHSAGCMVTGVRYQDGTVVDEEDVLKYTKIIMDPDGKGCILIQLNHAIEIGKYHSLVIENFGSSAKAMEKEEIAGMELVYENKSIYDGHKILTDGKKVYLWDEQCLLGTKLLDLTELGFDPERGDALSAGPGGNLLYVTLNGETKAYIVGY